MKQYNGQRLLANKSFGNQIRLKKDITRTGKIIGGSQWMEVIL